MRVYVQYTLVLLHRTQYVGLYDIFRALFQLLWQESPPKWYGFISAYQRMRYMESYTVRVGYLIEL